MQKYVCSVCGYVYDPEKGDPKHGIEPGTKFEDLPEDELLTIYYTGDDYVDLCRGPHVFKDLPEDWACPLCSVGKDMFNAQ